MMKPLKRTAILLIALVFAALSYSNPLYALSQQERELLHANAPWWWYQTDYDACNTTDEEEKLNGHTLPATRGGVGLASEIDNEGNRLTGGGQVEFKDTLIAASDTPPNETTLSNKELYKTYYIAMRWGYAPWNWDGTQAPPDVNAENKDFYAGTPRVIVTNTQIRKSVVLVVLDAGPAPWEGVDTTANNDPKGDWTNPTYGTPESYGGRVANIPQAAMDILEATPRQPDGSGTELVFNWAVDQSLTPGPAADSVANQITDQALACSGMILSIDGLNYSFPMEPQTKRPLGYSGYGNVPCNQIARGGCHWADPYYAFDMAFGSREITGGKSIYAIVDGTLSIYANAPNSDLLYRQPPRGRPDSEWVAHPECRAFRLYPDEKYGMSTHFFYGHLMNSVFEADLIEARANGERGVPVKAGQKIAEVADVSTGNTCWGYATPHLHIQQDASFLPFFNRMYDLLPE